MEHGKLDMDKLEGRKIDLDCFTIRKSSKIIDAEEILED